MGSGTLQEWADGLRFEQDGEWGERLVSADDRQVTHPFERRELQHRVDELVITEHSDVLEVGFGCGFSAERIQQARPRSHTIMECAPEVLKRLRVWAADKPSVRVMEGTWQERLPELGTFDCIFLDDHDTAHLAERAMEACPDAAYRQEYVRLMHECGRSHAQATERIMRNWHSRPGTRLATGEGSEFQNWADSLFFSLDKNGEEQLLDADGQQVMMRWEKPYMERCVAALGIDPSCSVLEVGFGCGYSAECIQRQRPKTHVIIECADAVLERLRAWAAERPNVVVLEGTWQSRLPELGAFDRVFFDDYGEPGLADREMERCPDPRYRELYEAILEAEGGTHFEAFVSMVLKWHSNPATQISGYLLHPLNGSLEEAEVTYERIDVSVPEHCNYFFADRAVVPLIKHRAAALHHGARSMASRSTRSARSGSGHRSVSSEAWSSSARSLAGHGRRRSRSRSHTRQRSL